MKSIKLSTDKEVKIKEMSVDDIDFCNDVPEMKYDGDNLVAIKNLSKARTAWIRKGIEGADDKFIKSLTLLELEISAASSAILLCKYCNLSEKVYFVKYLISSIRNVKL